MVENCLCDTRHVDIVVVVAADIDCGAAVEIDVVFVSGLLQLALLEANLSLGIGLSSAVGLSQECHGVIAILVQRVLALVPEVMTTSSWKH